MSDEYPLAVKLVRALRNSQELTVIEKLACFGALVHSIEQLKYDVEITQRYNNFADIYGKEAHQILIDQKKE